METATTTCNDKSIVLWQEWGPKTQPAILITPCDETHIIIEQGLNMITLSPESINKLCTVLKGMTKIMLAMLLLLTSCNAQPLFLAKDSIIYDQSKSKWEVKEVPDTSARSTYIWGYIDSMRAIGAMDTLSGVFDTSYTIKMHDDTTAILQGITSTGITFTDMNTVVLRKSKPDTEWHLDEIIPEYIMGVDNNGGVFVFGAERIIHRYGVVNKGYYGHSFIMPAGQGDWIRESYDIRGAAAGDLRRLNVMIAYGHDNNSLTWLGIQCHTVKGTKLSHRKIKVYNHGK